ncbi:MAG: GFA family protein [Parasphingopyxis sp.]|uniref:GFA family protein n=1 Tax=Parasphingopyxis sp. TaxID=1920299 RepID=UPI003FA15660
MSEALAGGCQCGAVRFIVSGARPPVYACHCRECQKQSASAFALSVPVARDRLTLEGETATWERPSASGATTRCHFCPRCGTRLYHASSRNAERITIKGGAFDDTDWIAPQAHLWVSRKQGWMMLPDGAPTHETQPDDLSAWRDGLVGDWR